MLDNKGLKQSSNELIINLNKAIWEYNFETDRSEKNSKLNNVIDICDDYITKIPRTLRNNRKETGFCSKNGYPEVEIVLEIQKQAVRYLHFPEEKTPTKAYKKLLQDFFRSYDAKEKKLLEGKPMDLSFYPEFRYKGNTLISNWLENKYADCEQLRSYKEAMREKSYMRDLPPLYSENFKENQVSIKNGLLYYKNALLDTSLCSSNGHSLTKEVLFVTSPEGNIYINDPKLDLDKLGVGINHSVFLGGKPALCAGTLKVKNGAIEKITLASGHYKPGRKELVNFLSLLKNANVDLSNILVYQIKDFARNASDYLKNKGFCLPRYDVSDPDTSEIKDPIKARQAQLLFNIGMREETEKYCKADNKEKKTMALKQYFDYCLQACRYGHKGAKTKFLKKIPEEFIKEYLSPAEIAELNQRYKEDLINPPLKQPNENDKSKPQTLAKQTYSPKKNAALVVAILLGVGAVGFGVLELVNINNPMDKVIDLNQKIIEHHFEAASIFLLYALIFVVAARMVAKQSNVTTHAATSQYNPS